MAETFLWWFPKDSEKGSALSIEVLMGYEV